MARYDLTDKKQTEIKDVSHNSKKIKHHYGTTVYDDVPKSNDDIYVITQYGDRLDLLASQFYGDQHLWWFIGHTNNISTMNIDPGTRLRISFDFSKASDLRDKS